MEYGASTEKQFDTNSFKKVYLNQLVTSHESLVSN